MLFEGELQGVSTLSAFFCNLSFFIVITFLRNFTIITDAIPVNIPVLKEKIRFSLSHPCKVQILEVHQ